MSRSLRILSVCRVLPTPNDPAYGTFVINRIAAMAKLADVEIIQPIPFFPWLRPLPAWVADGCRLINNVRVVPTPMFYTPGILKSIDGNWLARAIAAEAERVKHRSGIDLIDAHFGYPEGVGCVQLGKQLGIPVFITVRGHENEYVSKPIIGRKLVEALKAARGCVSVSHSLKKLLIRYGIEESTVRVIQNAVDDTVFCRHSRFDARTSLGLDPRHELIVSVGSLIQRKRHHVLVEAFKSVLAERSNARLAIIGGDTLEPDYAPRLKTLIAELGVGSAVSLVGSVEPRVVARWLQAADIFALATSREGCCNAVLEALAVGRPVVSTPVGDNPQFVRDGKNGFLVAVDDVASLGSAMAAALRRNDWNEEAIANGLGVGQWDRVAREVLAFFEERLARYVAK